LTEVFPVELETFATALQHEIIMKRSTVQQLAHLLIVYYIDYIDFIVFFVVVYIFHFTAVIFLLLCCQMA